MLGVCYYPEHWPRSLWAHDAQRMAELGIGFARIGEFAWALMEPEPGQFEFGWLDDAIGTLGDAGLKVMLGTPTATPPKWLIDSVPDVLAYDRDGRVRGFGSRRHYCFSSGNYRRESRRITEVLAKRYGGNGTVSMWQTDNEFGCHDTVRSYSPMARDAFRLWLKAKYGDIGALNEAWGNVFWSMLYRSFDEIELPNLTVTEANPSHWLDFYRFSSDQVISFHREQAAIIREHAPDALITHNAMGHFTDYDHFALGAEVDILTWDSYPLGFLSQSRKPDGFKAEYLRQGNPDFAGFHHDLYRGCGKWAVIEQQPGPVNWAPDNPAPLPGMLKLWSLEALAHGAEFTAPFRWRQAPFAQEQNHAGLLRPDDQPAAGYGEIAEVRDVLPALSDAKGEAKVALVFDYDSLWMAEIQPQGSGWHTLDICMEWYAAARSLGLDVDVVAPGRDLSAYDMVLVPALLHVSQGALDALKASGARIVVGPRCGSKDENGNVPEGLAPGRLRELIHLTVARSETVPGHGGNAGVGAWHVWRDEVDTALEPSLQDTEGRPILYQHGRVRMFTALPDDALLRFVVKQAASDAGLEVVDLPEGLRLRTGRGQRFAFNYAKMPRSLPDGVGPADGFTVGGRMVPPGGAAVWEA
ncbi:beta-galactosidase [Parvularcula lutaonensis]|uniref:Beta-galactosidase n=1 Tax=Parvularcula lutaonensis TaxID=491923 RepID=A0ABV7MHM8_9PROT|nr:beta-galactosidase [Parvularcula lutaonensis]